jgi:hypothetical protein
MKTKSKSKTKSKLTVLEQIEKAVKEEVSRQLSKSADHGECSECGKCKCCKPLNPWYKPYWQIPSVSPYSPEPFTITNTSGVISIENKK